MLLRLIINKFKKSKSCNWITDLATDDSFHRSDESVEVDIFSNPYEKEVAKGDYQQAYSAARLRPKTRRWRKKTEKIPKWCYLATEEIISLYDRRGTPSASYTNTKEDGKFEYDLLMSALIECLKIETRPEQKYLQPTGP